MKYFIWLFGLFFFSTSLLTAQPLNKSTYGTMIKIAEEKEVEKDYYSALEWYEKAYEDRKDYDLAAKIGQLNYELKDYKRAISWFRRSLRRDKEGKYNEYLFPYARSLRIMGNNEDAMEYFTKALEVATDEQLKQAIQIEIQGMERGTIDAASKGLTISNAGKEINSKTSEYSPIYGRGDRMYFCSNQMDDKAVLDEASEEYYVKIYSAVKGEEGWEGAEPLGEAINRKGFHVGNVAMSKDGRKLYFTRQTLQGNELATSQLFYSEGGDAEWGAAKETQGINGDFIIKQPSFGELFGKDVLFFSSNQPGGEGGFDLYYSTLQGDGQFGEPVNLGPKINTPANEITPSYFDGTLYFSSTGHPGMGGYDIFYTVWNGVVWSNPANMGDGYNSIADDRYFSLDSDGYKGFLTSNRINDGARSVKGKTCCDDIYNVSLKKIEADASITVVDAETGEPIPGATVRLQRKTDERKIDVDDKTGNGPFTFPLELDYNYEVVGEHPDYFMDSLTFGTSGLTDSKTYDKVIELQPQPVYVTITKEEPIELELIFYDFDDDKILPEAEPDLQLVLELLQEYPKMVVEMSSHTDARGNDNYNLNLSQRRAESARRWLLNRDETVTRRRIQAVGYGETQPKTVTAKLAANYTWLNAGDVLTEEFINALATEELQEEAHQLNRRTEFRIIEGPTNIKIEEKRLIRRGVNEVAPEKEEDEKKN